RVADKTVLLLVHGELATTGIESFDTYRQRTRRLAVTRADAEAEHVLTDPCHRDAIADPPQFQVDRLATLVLHLWPTTVGRGEQTLPLDGLTVLVRLDGSRGQGDSGMLGRHQVTGGAHPVDPAGVHRRLDHLITVEQVEHKTLVRSEERRV